MAALYSFTRLLVWLAILAGALVGVLRLTALRWVRLPSQKADPVFGISVLPSLKGGDLVVTFRLGQPDFGDLVLCPEPGAPQRFVVGRIIGKGGDRVRIVNAKPEVNGDSFTIERGCDPPTFSYVHPDTGETVEQPCEMEAVGGGLHRTGDIGSHKVIPENREYNVPEGSWFLLSDNRLTSYDSRDYGYVPASSCKERVFGRLVSKEGWSDFESRMSYIP